MEQKQNKNSPKLLAVGGGKGGVGKTIVSVCLAIALARKGFRVILIDCDFGGANLHTVMGMYMPNKTLYDFFSKRDVKLKDLVSDTAIPGLQLIFGALGSDRMANINFGEKQKTIRQIRHLEADFVIADLGAGLSFNEIDFFNAADLNIVVANPEPTSIQECYNFIKVALMRKLNRSFQHEAAIRDLFKHNMNRQAGSSGQVLSELTDEIGTHNESLLPHFLKIVSTFNPKLILNKAKSKLDIREARALQAAVLDLLGFDLEIFGFIPETVGVINAVNHGQPMELFNSSTALTYQFQQIVSRKIGMDAPCLSPAVLPEKTTRNRISPYLKNDDESRVCSIYCKLWGNCRFQDGGAFCAMPEMEYKNRTSKIGRRVIRYAHKT